MTTFEKPTTCNHCSKFLKGRIFQVNFQSISYWINFWHYYWFIIFISTCHYLLIQGYRCERCLIACHKPCIPFAGRCGMKPPPELPPRPPLLSPRHDSDPNAINHTIQVILLFLLIVLFYVVCLLYGKCTVFYIMPTSFLNHYL